MDITETFYAPTRADWRQWLADNHATAREIWLVTYSKQSGKPTVAYLEAVEEALCFGWIDGIAKKIDTERTAQRFTPRRPKSNWTQLNIERAKRLIEQGLMTDAGRATLPDLSPDAYKFPTDIIAALQQDPVVWANYQAFQPVYQRIRVSYIDIVRKQPEEFQKRLDKFIQKTRENKTFGGIE